MKSSSKGKRVQALLPWVLPGVFVAVWILVGYAELLPHYLLPKPSKIIETGYAYLFHNPGDSPYAGRFLSDAAASLMRVSIGFMCATVCAIPLGVLSGRVATVNRLLSTFLNAIRAVPGITWLPLAMVWLGIGMKTTVFLVALAAFFPIYLNTASGANQVNIRLLQAGAMMGVGRFQGTFRILLPGSMPHIMTGLRLGLGISWAYLVLGELTGVPNGLGAVIMDARMLGRVDMIIVGMLIIAMVGKMGDGVLVSFLKACLKSARRMT
jgi:sulfonate transport system permease protein